MKKFRNCGKIFMPKKLRQKNGGLTFDFKFKDWKMNEGQR